MKKEQILWNKAKRIIPDGNSLFSKRPENILPDLWPTYYSKSKDCFVWDLNKKKFIDMFFGVGTNLLGYANNKIDNAVIKSIGSSNMSSLNCPEEVYLAEKLIKLHRWANMVKFARSGGEANAIAIRISRAASGKDGVAICGYHGWHDWYMAANIDIKSNLDNHLLKGLNTIGVPKKLAGTVKTFDYNNFAQLKKIVEKFDIGTIKMEVKRNFEPKDNFLLKVRKLASKKNIVLIFDECTTGFRQTNGGLHKYYKIEPDLCIFGKALGNGYAITSVIGKREIMENAQKTFISSTFWGEKIGYVAGLKTLEVMKDIESWKIVTNIGNLIKQNWKKIAERHNIKIEINGISALPSFIFKNDKDNILRTYFSQEMFNHGILASNVIFVSICHNKKILNKYFKVVDKIFHKISICSRNRIANLIKYGYIKSSFERLN